MDIHSIPVPDLLALNKVTRGKLHASLADAWDSSGAQDIDLQVTFERGVYRIHIIGLVGDGVVCERSILVRGDRTLPEATRIVLLLLWVSTIQARTARALARGDAAVLGRSASRP